MIADIQTQEVVSVSIEKAVQYVIVQDPELIYVGGGSATAHLFWPKLATVLGMEDDRNPLKPKK